MKAIIDLFYRLRLRYWRYQECREQAAVYKKVAYIIEVSGVRAKHTKRIRSMAIRYYGGASLEQIVLEDNVTRERVRQCIAKFIRTEANYGREESKP